MYRVRIEGDSAIWIPGVVRRLQARRMVGVLMAEASHQDAGATPGLGRVVRGRV